MLPSWHAYERAAEYFSLTYGIEQVYTNLKKLKGKVVIKKKNQPLPVVVQFCYLWGRVVAAILWPFHNLGMKLIYSKIHSSIGISKAGISGGGSLPLHIDKFFEAIGVKLQNGYGLTETSPVITCRWPDNNVLGTVGHPINLTEILIVDIETGSPLSDGSKGIIKVRGPQVMKGYYKNASATKEAIDEDGWFNTGDIGWIVPKYSSGMSSQCGGLLVLEGRAKDTIVLRTGENVEPSEIEEAAMRSKLIKQIVVIGQDQRRLGALVVPNMDEVIAAAKNRLAFNDENSELSHGKILDLLYEEVRKWTADCSFHVGPIMIVEEPFTKMNC